MYLAFLDEFGHIGPFAARNDPRYNQSPVFGLAGYILPHTRAREFATWFFQQKNQLLEAEIRRYGAHPATWEKKGTELFNTRNIKKYPEIFRSGARMINKIKKLDGALFYYGREKYLPPNQSNATGLYTTVLSHSIRQIDRYCKNKGETFLMILDQHDSRIRLLATAAKTMFGNDAAHSLIEPPFQVESHLYQTIQAADWIAAIIGRLEAYKISPKEYSDWEWTEKLFERRINSAATHSLLWRHKP